MAILANNSLDLHSWKVALIRKYVKNRKNKNPGPKDPDLVYPGKGLILHFSTELTPYKNQELSMIRIKQDPDPAWHSPPL
jgi:hypothetical protein